MTRDKAKKWVLKFLNYGPTDVAGAITHSKVVYSGQRRPPGAHRCTACCLPERIRTLSWFESNERTLCTTEDIRKKLSMHLVAYDEKRY